MASPTAVDDQITDAIAQANVKVIGEAPAMAMSALYQSLAHSTGILFQNAVAAQQQQNTMALAASNQGILQIYTVDAAAAASAGETRSPALPEALQARAQQATTATKTAFAATTDINSQIEAAVKLANDAVLGNAGDFAYAIRAGADAMNAALQSIGKALHEDLMRTLRMAATAATLETMLRDPS
jgi:hypothetical protein